MAIQTDLDKLSANIISPPTDPSAVTPPVDPNANLVDEVTDTEKELNALPENEGIQLASASGGVDIVEGIIKKVKDATGDAEKRVYGNINQKDLIVDMGDSLIIKPADNIEIEDFKSLLSEGDEKAPGINMFKLGKDLTSDESMKALFAIDQFDQDLASFLEKVKTANQPLFKSLSRDKLSIEAMAKLAEKNGLYNITTRMLSRKPGEVLPAEDTVGSIIAMVNLGKLANTQVNKAITSGDEKDKMIALRFISVQARLSASISGNVAEYARGMATVRWAKKISSGGIDQFSNDLNLAVDRMKGDDTVDYLLNFYASLPKHQQLEFAKKGIFAKGMDALVEIYINTLLSSPVTHIVNMSGNALFQALKVVETLPASMVGAVRTKLLPGQNPNDRVFMKEAGYKLHGIKMALNDAVLLSAKTFMTEKPGIDGTKIDLRNTRAIGNEGNVSEIAKNLKNGHIVSSAVDMLGVYYRMSSRFLITEDEFFKVIAMRSATYSEAIRRHEMVYNDVLRTTGDIKEAKKQAGLEYDNAIKNPDTTVIENYAKELTFTGDLDGILASGQQFTSTPLLKFFIPFYKTPVNIFTEVFDRTLPFNVIRKLRNGTGREVDEATAKIISGWLIGFSWYSLVSGDVNDDVYCVGSGPDDARVRKNWFNMNNQQYSCVHTMDDGSQRSYTFGRLDPVSPILAMASDLHYYLQNEPDQEKIQFMLKVFTLAVTDYADQHPMLQGGHEIFEILSPSTQMSSSDRFDRAMSLIGEKAGQAFVSTSPLPTFKNKLYPSSSSFSAWLSRMDDPVKKSSKLPPGEATNPITGESMGLYTELSPAVRGFYTALEKTKAKNPLWNKGLKPDLNMWGEEIEMTSGLSKWEYVSPIRIKELKYNKLDDELVNLGNAGGGAISSPRNKLGDVLLNRDEYYDYVMFLNQVDGNGNLPTDDDYDPSDTLKNVLMEVITGTTEKTDKAGDNFSSLYFDAVLPEEKVDILNYFVTQRKKSARKQLIQKYDRLQFHFPINE